MSCWKRCELILNGWDLDTPTGFFVSKRMIFRSEHCAFETFQYTSVQSLREKRLTLHIETYETCPKSWKGTQSIETRHSKGSRNYTQKYSHPNTNCKNTSNNLQPTNLLLLQGYTTVQLAVGRPLTSAEVADLEGFTPRAAETDHRRVGGPKNPKKKRRMSNSLGW